MACLDAPVGASFAVHVPGSRSIHLMNATARDLLMALLAEGAAGDERRLGGIISRRYGLDVAAAGAEAAKLMRAWREAGLLAPPTPSADDWVLAPAKLPAGEAPDVTVAPGGCAIGVRVHDGTLRRRTATLLNCLRSARPPRHWLERTGDASGWRLTRNREPVAAGAGADAALTALLAEATDVACRSEERLLVVHGAGLSLGDGTGLLLVAPGGSGKSTLATALNAAGMPLLSDDVVPVDPQGGLVGLGTPLCLKEGSWGVLSRARPDLLAAPIVTRLGQSVRYVPPLGEAAATTLACRVIAFPRFLPGAAPEVRALTPEEAFRRLIEAEAVIRGLTQDKLRRLAAWVTSVPAVALTYSDLEAGLSFVREVTRPRGAAPGAA